MASPARFRRRNRSSHMLVSTILTWSALTALSGGLTVSAVSIGSLSQDVGQTAVSLAEKLEGAIAGLWPGQVNDYGGQQVYRLKVPEMGLSRQHRRELVEQVRHVANLLDLDIWRLGPTHIDLLISHSQLSTLSNLLPNSISLPSTPFLSSSQLSQLTRSHRPRRPSPPSDEPTWNTSTITTAYHDAYHPLVNISGFMDALAQDFSGIAEKVVIGQSAEGRDIEGLRLHLPNDAEEEGMDMKKKNKSRKKWMRWTERFVTTTLESDGEGQEEEAQEIFLMGGQHAREWISPASILYFAHRLVLDSEHDATTRKLLEAFTFTLVPTINPDGYIYTHEHSRLWRKNRQDVGGGPLCMGIDMNANWGYKWSSSPSLLSDGSSNAYSNPCSDSFPGSSAFEAVETRAIADYLHARHGTVRAFIDIHSYGQLFMFPYSYSCSDFPGDAETLMEAGLGVARAIKAHSGTQYKTGQACDLVYRMAGDSVDFAYGEEGIRWAYSAELRDTGTYGFLLPPREIRPTAEEMTEGLLYLAEFIRTTELGPRG